MKMRKKHIRDQIVYSVLMPSILCASCAADPKSAEEACISNTLQATKDDKNGDYSSAESHYLQAVQQSEHSNNALQLPRVLQALAKVYSEEKKYNQAEASLRRALERYSAIEKEGRLMSDNRLNIVEGRVATMEKLAAVMAQQGKSDQAAELYRQTIALSKNVGGSVEDNHRISTNYGELLRALNKNEQADELKIEVDSTNLTPFEVNRDMDAEMPLVRKKPGLEHLIPLKTLALASERLQKKDRLQQALYYLAIIELCCGQPVQAEAHFRKCSSISKTKDDGGVRSDFKGNLACEIAAVACSLDIQGKQAEAEKFYGRAREYDFGATCETLQQLASLMIVSDKDKYARVLCERLCTISNQIPQNRNGQLAIAQILQGLATQLRDKGKLTDAIQLDKKALEIAEKTYGPKNLKTVSPLYGLGADYHYIHKFGEANQLRKRAVAIVERSNDPTKMNFADILYLLAETDRGLEQYTDAAAVDLKALALFQKANSPMVGPTLFTIAEIYRSAKKYAESQDYYKRAINVYKKTKGKQSLEVGRSIFGMGESCRQLRQYTEAKQLYKRALPILEATAPNTIIEGQILCAIAQNYQNQGKCEEAHSYFEKALPVYERTQPSNQLAIAQLLFQWARNYESRGDAARAEVLYKRALPIFEKTKGAEMNVVFTYDLLSDAYQHQHRYDDAEIARKQALAKVKKMKGADDLEVAKTLAALATTCQLAHKDAEAADAYKQSLRIYQKNKSENTQQAKSIAKKLTELLSKN